MAKHFYPSPSFFNALSSLASERGGGKNMHAQMSTLEWKHAFKPHRNFLPLFIRFCAAKWQTKRQKTQSEANTCWVLMGSGSDSAFLLFALFAPLMEWSFWAASARRSPGSSFEKHHLQVRVASLTKVRCAHCEIIHTWISHWLVNAPDFLARGDSLPFAVCWGIFRQECTSALDLIRRLLITLYTWVKQACKYN